MCHRSINYVADMMETKYGIPWIKVNFIGADATAKSLRKIAAVLRRPGADRHRSRRSSPRRCPRSRSCADEVRPRTEGKTAMLFVGGSRAHHYQELFNEMGMKTIAAGYEFAHRDDYEGRQVLPTIKVDADSRNIEEIEVEPDPTRFQPRKTRGRAQGPGSEAGYTFKDYDGMIPDMDDRHPGHRRHQPVRGRAAGARSVKPDIFCAGIKEKFAIQKLGVPMKQLHSYDYGGPYAGFRGAVNFYREIDRMVNSKVWGYMKAPWQENPELSATYVWE